MQSSNGIPNGKHGDDSNLFWVSMVSSGIYNMSINNGFFNDRKYIDILQDHLFESVSNSGIRGDFIFRSHLIRITKDYFSYKFSQLAQRSVQLQNISSIKNVIVIVE